MLARVPNIFLSSTFFDLRQIRADLRDFVEQQLGYRLLASEYPTFPVDPSVDTIENCKRRVEEDADVFVLLIGSRYGSIPPGAEHSVTNLEYLTAREKNPDADFSHIVDTPKLFEFIKDVRSSDRVWMFPFERAQDISATLRAQLAYEMMRGLQCSSSLRGGPEDFRGLTGEAFRIAAEKQSGWAIRLVSHLVQQEIRASVDLRLDYHNGIAVGIGERVREEEVSAWIVAYTQQAERLVQALMTLMSRILNDAIEKQDVRSIVYGARQVGAAYRDALEWAARIRRAHVPDDWRPIVYQLALMLDPLIGELELFGPTLDRKVDEALSKEGPGPHVIDYTFHARVADMGRYEEEVHKLRKRRGLR